MAEKNGEVAAVSKWIWIGLLGAPLAFAFLLSVNYALVPWACAAQRGSVLHGLSAVAFALAAFTSWRAWRALRQAPEGEGDRTAERRRFLAEAAVLLSVYFLIVIVALEVPNLILEPCS